VQFSPRSLRETCDEAVLWYTLERGPGGSLRQVRLTCQGGDAPVRGAVAWAACTIEEAVDESPRPDGDATQDEVWLDEGDQLFGRVVRADRRTVEVQGRWGSRKLPWTQVRGLVLRRTAAPPVSTTGAHVRLLLDSGLTPEKDILEGVLEKSDGRAVTLRHSLLGEVRIDRAFVREVRPLFHGRRIELDGGFHHLGESGKVAPGLDPPRAAGPAWRGSFTLDAVPEEARLVLSVIGLLGPGDAEGKGLAEGALRTEVVVNGRRVDYLNRQVDRSSRQPRRLTVSLPRDALRTGANAVEVRQTPDPRSGRYPHCGIFGLALEIPQ
jgi:hypothetical protein